MKSVPDGAICGVVVTYRPVSGRIAAVLAAARPQVARLVVIDNGSGADTAAGLRSLCATLQCDLLTLPDNLGLGAALNRGIGYARRHGCAYLLCLDQDSMPADGMVEGLQSAWENLLLSRQAVAAVGPTVIDSRLGTRGPFVSFGAFGVTRRDCADRHPGDTVAADFVITSGMFTSVGVFDQVGMFDEGLFIDNIDLEWCFRASSLGYDCYGVCGAELDHCLGDEVTRIWLGRWMPLYRHVPLRQYYIMRNRILLYKKQYSPFGWILQDIFRTLFKLVVFSVVFSNRMQNLHMMMRGLIDGVRGRTGAFED